MNWSKQYLSWRLVGNDITAGVSVRSSPIQFVKDLDGGTECTLNKFAVDSELEELTHQQPVLLFSETWTGWSP